MRALIFDGTLRLEADAPIPPHEGEALIRVHMAGICSTDTEITRGYKGFHGILGHEFVGEVASCADKSWVGRRVCGEINVRCHRCRFCVEGVYEHCENRKVLGIVDRPGAFAEYLTLPAENLHLVPDCLEDDEAVYVEPLAAAFEILGQVRISPSDHVLILGDGKLGLLCAQVVMGTGATTTLLGKHESKLTIARSFGVTAITIRSDAPENVDVVIEATGSTGGFSLAVELVRPRGTIVLKSTTARPVSVDLSTPVVKELTIIGSRCGPFSQAIDALARGDVRVQPLTERTYPLDRGIEAMHHAGRRGVLKVLLDMRS